MLNFKKGDIVTFKYKDHVGLGLIKLVNDNLILEYQNCETLKYQYVKLNKLKRINKQGTIEKNHYLLSHWYTWNKELI